MLVTALSVALSAMLDTLQEAFARPPHLAPPECSARQHGGSRAAQQACRRPRRASAGHHRDAAGVEPVTSPAQKTGVSWYTPKTSRSAATISPSVARARTASMIAGMVLSGPAATSLSASRRVATLVLSRRWRS